MILMASALSNGQVLTKVANKCVPIEVGLGALYLLHARNLI